jgi:hypothetical protein
VSCMERRVLNYGRLGTLLCEGLFIRQSRFRAFIDTRSMFL